MSVYHSQQVRHYELNKEAIMGKLQEMLNMQNDLQARLGYDIQAMDAQERTEFIKEFSIHLNQETNEMLYELPFFKPWKDYSGMTLEEHVIQHQKATEEFIDMLHFFLNIALALGADEDKLHEAYMAKNAENHVRQDGGYTHDKSFR